MKRTAKQVRVSVRSPGSKSCFPGIGRLSNRAAGRLDHGRAPERRGTGSDPVAVLQPWARM